ncbi:hypothetical protein [Paenibacillus sp. B-A-8]|uniref:hypothetical protein n=1 Tax=Paenibacillus sp. B-A-8 TaxID=3400419 RepID=UPI003B01A374
MRNFDNEIQTKEIEAAAIKEEMAIIQQEFKTELTVFFSDLFRKKSKELVITNPDKAVELGEDKLKKLKTDVENLITNASEIVDRHFENENLWWHMKENNTTYKHYNDHRLPDFLDNPLRFSYGELGKIFEDHSVIKIPLDHEKTSSYESGFSKLSGKVKYAYGFDVSKTVIEIYKKYSSLHEKALGLRKEIEKIGLEKKKSQIGDIWDSL